MQPQTTKAQSIKGKVKNSNNEPLTGASVHWLRSAIGTSTDSSGQFELQLPKESIKKLVISFVGYQSDTITITNETAIEVKLSGTKQLGEVVVKGKRPGIYISEISPIKTEVITQVELKKAYYEWLIISKKLSVLDQNEKVLNFMISNSEIRYKNGLEKINAYYKAKAAIGSLQSMRLMLQNEIKQKRIFLNTLMSRPDKNEEYDIDTSYSIRDYSPYAFDSSLFINSRSDIKAIEKDIILTYLKQDIERKKLKPEFGIRYEHMFGFGGLPQQYTIMGMVRLPFVRWSAKMNKANIEGLKWKAESLNAQKKVLVNEYTGIAWRMKTEIDLKRKQIDLFENNIIPALRKNYQTMQLGYEQNTEELFQLYDAWEVLNMTQLEYLEQLQQLLAMQVELERILQIK